MLNRGKKRLAIICFLAVALILNFSAGFIDIREAALSKSVDITNLVELAEVGVGIVTALLFRRLI